MKMKLGSDGLSEDKAYGARLSWDQRNGLSEDEGTQRTTPV